MKKWLEWEQAIIRTIALIFIPVCIILALFTLVLAIGDISGLYDIREILVSFFA